MAINRNIKANQYLKYYLVFQNKDLQKWSQIFLLEKSLELFCCCSVAESCPTLCNCMNCRMPGFPVLHYIPEFAQTHVHWVGNAIQPFHPLSNRKPLILCIKSLLFKYLEWFLLSCPNPDCVDLYCLKTSLWPFSWNVFFLYLYIMQMIKSYLACSLSSTPSCSPFTITWS